MTTSAGPSGLVSDRSFWYRGRERKHWPQGRLPQDFWTLYASSLLVDLGLCLYFFMFNLFLVEHQFTEQAIGFIAAALTVGAIAGTVPASLLSRRFGLRTMMLLYVSVAPLCLASRTLFLQMPAQLGLAFLAGAATSIWSVCFSPTLAKLTTQENRALGFSLFIATGISSGALAGLIGGYLPDLLRRLGPRGYHVDGIKGVLLLACAIVALAAIAIPRLRIGAEKASEASRKVWSGFLVRFMVAIAVWNFSLSFFAPFANVYLSRHLGLPVTRIGTIFSISQLIQVVAVMTAPLLYRRVGLVPGIAITQMGTAALLWGLSRASGNSTATWIYLSLTALQWMGGPGISSLLMNRTPEEHRSQASAMQNVVNLVAQAGSTALAGRVFGKYGYSEPLAVNASLAALAAVLLYTLLKGNSSENGAVCKP